MVMSAVESAVSVLSLVAQAQEKSQTLLHRLDPPKRVVVLAAMAGLIILGFGLVALTWLGGRVTRRYMNQGNRSRPPLDENDWARKPLIPVERKQPEEEETQA